MKIKPADPASEARPTPTRSRRDRQRDTRRLFGSAGAQQDAKHGTREHRQHQAKTFKLTVQIYFVRHSLSRSNRRSTSAFVPAILRSTATPPLELRGFADRHVAGSRVADGPDLRAVWLACWALGFEGFPLRHFEFRIRSGSVIPVSAT
jgi:hypothetical protein